ncbi:glycerate kinase [Novosphingobium sp. MW5]|nr:glycerate kinase [Novosphingobium sp. MW5]
MDKVSDTWARGLLRELFDAAVAAADPREVLDGHLPEKPKGRCVVVGAGKASAAMATAVEAAWPEVDLSGCVVVPYGYVSSCSKVKVLEAGHPVPDANSVTAARELLAQVEGLSPDDQVLALISGGGSATLCLPAEGLSLEDKQATNRLLLRSGLDIRTMNAVRRRVSGIKGGRLAAAAAPARVVTLAVSDIPGDDASAIASGPTVADPTAQIDLTVAVRRLGKDLPSKVRELLLKPGHAILAESAPVRTIASAAGSLSAAAARGREAGLSIEILGDAIEGEAREVAQVMAATALKADQPTLFLSGGETTVTVRSENPGQGGRNTEFALALALALRGKAGIWAIACDTDGEDGANLGAAGAIITPDTLSRSETLGLDPAASLARHDSGGLFSALGDLVVTGPTCTNVNDFRAILVLPQSAG